MTLPLKTELAKFKNWDDQTSALKTLRSLGAGLIVLVTVLTVLWLLYQARIGLLLIAMAALMTCAIIGGGVCILYLIGWAFKTIYAIMFPEGLGVEDEDEDDYESHADWVRRDMEL